MIPFDTLKLVEFKHTQAQFEIANGLMLHLEAHAPGVFRIRCGEPAKITDEHLNVRAKSRLQMQLARTEAIGEMTKTDHSQTNAWVFEQGEYTLSVHTQPFKLVLRKLDSVIFSTDDQFDKPVAVELEGDIPTHWGLHFALQEEQKIYGLGLSGADFDRRQSLIVSDNREFAALPFAWTTDGWGLFVNASGHVQHELGIAQNPDTYALYIKNNVLDLFIFTGEPADIFNQYSALTGRSGQPPLWAMGTWLQQDTQGLSQLMDQAMGLRQAGFPFDVISSTQPAIMGFSSDKLNMEWDSARLPDPRLFLANLNQHQLHGCLSTFPGVLQSSELFTDLQDRAWLLTNDEGMAYVFDGVPATAGQAFGLLDLTYKDAYKFWSEKHQVANEEGFGALSCVLGFDLPDDVSARSGESAEVLRLSYPYLMRQALFDAVSNNKVPPEGVVIGSDLTFASHRLPWHQVTVEKNDWGSLQKLLQDSLALQASGQICTYHELGNVADTNAFTSELYLRFLGLSVFSGGFGMHAKDGFLPFDFDEKTQERAKTLMQLRYRLIPYILGVIEDSVRTGLPVQRTMALAFPNDAESWLWNQQFLLGPALLVAPVVQAGKEKIVYLPEGEAWWDLNTGWRYEGGQALSVDCEVDTVPVFGREGHMLCMGPALNHLGEFNSARILDEVWMFGMPIHNPVVMRNKIRVMQMQGSSYIKGLEGLRILQSEGLEVKRRGAEVRISRER